jgi:hypothetical protein
VTWVLLSDDFPGDLYHDELSDAAVRTHVEGLCWSADHLLDGRLRKRDLVRFAFTRDPKAAAAELVDRGYWRDEGDAWRIVHHLEHQPPRDVVERRRQLNAERQARHRERKLTEAEKRAGRTDDVTRDVTRYATRDPGREGNGGKGQGSKPATDHRHGIGATVPNPAEVDR